MKIIDKIIHLLKTSNCNQNSVFEIAEVVLDNVPYWIMVEDDDYNEDYLGIDFFEILNIEDDTLTFCCCGEWQDSYIVIIKINKSNELYVHDFYEHKMKRGLNDDKIFDTFNMK